MAARITVFCHKSVAHVTAPELLAGVELSDLWTIAEEFDVPDDLVETALAHLRIENAGSDDEFKTFILYYGDESIYQCRIERWSDLADVGAVIEEHCELIAESSAASETQKRLQGVTETVFVQFGSNAGMEMAPTLASEIARWIAEKGDGIIEGADGTWWELGQWQQYERLIR